MLQITKGEIGDNAAGAGFFVDDQLVHSTQHALKRLDIYPPTRYVRGFLIFVIDLQETIRPALCLGDRLLEVALRCLQNTACIAASLRNYAVGVGFGHVAGALLVGLGRLNVPERRNHLGRRVHFLQDDLRDVNPGLVAVEGALQETLYRLFDLRAEIGQDRRNFVSGR